MVQKTPKECYDEYLAASQDNVPIMKDLVDTHMSEVSGFTNLITPAQARDAFIAALKEMPETTQADIEKAITDINGRIKAAKVSENLPVPLWLMRNKVHGDIDAENTKWLSTKAKECNYSVR